MNQRRKDSCGKVLKKGESQKKNNQYMYRWTDNLGERRCIYANSLSELREKEKQIEMELFVGISRTSVTLNEQINVYLSTKRSLAKSTYNNYKYYYEHVIKNSKIGQMRVSNIKKTDVLLFYRSLSEEGYSAGTIKILHKIIRPALQLACDDNIIAKNPADGCTKEYAEDMEKKYALTFEEEKEFLYRIQKRERMKRYYPLYAILLKTGMRISEAVGLTWKDVDMEKRTLDINHQVQYRMVNGKTLLYANETKTNAGKRIIPMDEELYQLFLEQRKEWLQMKKDNEFEVDGYRDFVFISHLTGKCMNHNNIRRMMRSIRDMNDKRDIQLPDISPHILRHTACCRLAESGCDIKVLQYLMGHSDIRTTMRIYNHVDIDRVKREMDKLKNLYSLASFSTPKCTPICTPNTPKSTPFCREIM